MDGDFGDAVPQAELGGAVPLAVADDPDVTAARYREIVEFGLEGLPTAPTGEHRGPIDGVERYLDGEGGCPRGPLVPGNAHGSDRHRGAEVVTDPLAIAIRRPAGGEVVVERVLGGVGALVPAGGERRDGRETHQSARDRHFGDARPNTELGSAVPLAVADDPDVATRDRREGVTLGLEGLPTAPAAEYRGPGERVGRHLDVEGRGPGGPLVPGDAHGPDGHHRAEVIADPLPIAVRRPARREVVVQGVLGGVGTLVRAGDD